MEKQFAPMIPRKLGSPLSPSASGSSSGAGPRASLATTGSGNAWLLEPSVRQAMRRQAQAECRQAKRKARSNGSPEVSALAIGQATSNASPSGTSRVANRPRPRPSPAAGAASAQRTSTGPVYSATLGIAATQGAQEAGTGGSGGGAASHRGPRSNSPSPRLCSSSASARWRRPRTPSSATSPAVSATRTASWRSSTAAACRPTVAAATPSTANASTSSTPGMALRRR
mmetsp:Transcript_115457/g.321674  ORF Transcript_115457/g.321674 Transcript_115457/m.321674 type:complete len:228 (+) Transcript_115457:213-896(+)